MWLKTKFLEVFLVCCFLEIAYSIECPKLTKPKALIAESAGLLEEFFEGGEKNHCEIDEIVLANIDQIPNTRLFNLLPKLGNLRFLTIDNCTIKDFPATSQSVALPKLRQFYMDLNCANKYTQPEFLNVVFFNKGSPWKLKDITQLKTDIDVSCKGEPHFSLNIRDKWFKSDYSFTNEMLQNVTFGLRILDLNDCNLDVKLVPPTLKLLELVDVIFQNGNLLDVMKKAPQLQDIAFSYVKNKNPPAMDKDTQEFLTKIGVTNHTSFWISKNNNQWAPGVVVPRKKSVLVKKEGAGTN